MLVTKKLLIDQRIVEAISATKELSLGVDGTPMRTGMSRASLVVKEGSERVSAKSLEYKIS